MWWWINTSLLKKLEKGIISIEYIPTGQQVADILTKRLPGPTFEYFVGKLRLIDIYSQAWKGVLANKIFLDSLNKSNSLLFSLFFPIIGIRSYQLVFKFK